MPVTDIDPTVDYYQCLGVARDASAEDVKRAYHAIARTCHPDSTGGDVAKEARFKLAAVAYGVLGDAARRVEYDAARADRDRRTEQDAARARRATATRDGHGAGGASGRYAPPGPGSRDVGKPFDLGSLVSDFLGGDLAKSLGGIAREVAQATVPSGPSPGADAAPPPRAPRRRSRGPRSRSARTATAHDGSRLRVDGDDVHSEVRVGLELAILGGRVTIPTLTGDVTVAIPPGTSGGSTLRLRGRGMPIAVDDGQEGRDGVGATAGTAGDHHVLVRVDVPRGDAAVAELRRILHSMGD